MAPGSNWVEAAGKNSSNGSVSTRSDDAGGACPGVETGLAVECRVEIFVVNEKLIEQGLAFVKKSLYDVERQFFDAHLFQEMQIRQVMICQGST
jgi:hypothetical protein